MDCNIDSKVEKTPGICMCVTRHEVTQDDDVLGQVLYTVRCIRKMRQLLSPPPLNRDYEKNKTKKILSCRATFILKVIGLLYTAAGRKPARRIPRFTQESSTGR
jgi:hypothetical protein